MSNNIKATIAIASLIIIAAVGIFILGKNRGSDLPSIVTQSSIINSNIVSKITASQPSVLPTPISSIVYEVSKVAEMPTKSQATSSTTSQSSNCNLPESENLVKTDDGCFEVEFVYADVSIFKDSITNNQNYNKFYDTSANRDILKSIAKDYFFKIKNKLVNSNHKITFHNSKKNNENNFSLSTTFNDQDYNKKFNIKGIVPVCSYNYNISTKPTFEFKFESIDSQYPCI
jgi:hypothetical protein